MIKNIFYKTLIGVCLLTSASMASATRYYLSALQVTAGAKNVNLSDSVSFEKDGSTQYYWFTLGEDGTTKNWCTEALDFTDTTSSYHLFYDADVKSGAANYKLTIDQTFTANIVDDWNSNGLVVVNDGVTFSANTLKSGSYKATIAGTSTVINTKDISGGQWNDGWAFGKRGSTIAGLNVTGNWTVSGSGGGYWSCVYVDKANKSIDNPDVVVNTTSGGDALYANIAYGTQFSSKTDALDLVSYFQVNAMTSNSGFWVSGTTTSKGQLNVVLTTNQANATTGGWLWEGYCDKTAATWELKDGGAKIALIMKGGKDADGNYYSQSFTGNKISFTGGVQLISGKLLINYNATDQDTHHGELKLSQAAGEVASFGNTGNAGGDFVFSNIVVEKGGVILAKCNGTVAGGNFTIDTLSLASGGIAYSEGGSGSLTIDFAQTGAYLVELIRDSAENGVKVISWTDGQTNAVSVDSTIMSITDGSGKEYTFESVNKADGLYVAYVAVPEASTYAAILGSLALIFVFIRRRK